MSEQRARVRLAPDVRRQQILAVAAALFVERGFEAVDMAAIAERADVARPTVYKYFASTEVLLEQLLDAAMQAVWADLAPVVAEGPYADREPLYREIFAVLRRHPESLRLLHSGGGPIFHRYLKTLLFERLAAHLGAHLPAEQLPYKRLLDCVLLENMAFWAVVEPSLDVEALATSLAVTLATHAPPPLPRPPV